MAELINITLGDGKTKAIINLDHVVKIEPEGEYVSLVTIFDGHTQRSNPRSGRAWANSYSSPVAWVIANPRTRARK
jgi:hypothetical protein